MPTKTVDRADKAVDGAGDAAGDGVIDRSADKSVATAVKAKSRRFKIMSMWLLGGAVLLVYLAQAAYRPRDFGEQTWTIARGDTLAQITAQLLAREVIGETLSWRLLARLDGLGTRLRVGEYRFPKAISLNRFLRNIAAGKGQVGIKITILEGWNFAKMRAELRAAAHLKPSTASMSAAQIMAALEHPDLHPEGRFFPDTYHYTAGATDLSVYRQAFDLMREKLDVAWQNRADNLAIDSKTGALILASIIEKESYVAAEQRKVSGVFHNRLEQGMRLQADPTVIYGLGDKYRGNITRAHLKTRTKYNTYTNAGLPPTPISLPGMSALQAATQPLRTEDLYFVAKGRGLHTFSQTLREHNKAVRAYIKRQRKL